MSDKNGKTKKAPKPQKEPKPARKPVEVNEANLKVVRGECAVLDYPLAKIRKALSCTWGEAVALRHAALKADKS
jgi:hypothetical protein